ncbi:MAG: F0F1 ATP synthase subunit A [Rhodospirillales bacterium]|nr:F0F1 ATP synthase subunit A [Rhodospirillales bacterium]MBT4006649.1 F0F1 ATP synthase subunit A [Rhodospirillales bacterium]MBT5076222.1 F0F1 ATP synthase subunit A [Rhodospirillales bacterium]MBT5113927.1 F0F1 ATP synthase subunit A [Rhodospirillales bacterium]MBT5672455.1 F0F1 ATP synthase subunit A [Rhodospirillales bacterium]
MASPLQQFEIKPLARLEVGGMDVSFTNSSLFMMIVIMAVTLFMVLGMRKRAMVPGRWQSTVELFYEFIAGLVRDNVGSAGRPYFPFIFSLFMFILFANCIGLVPYAFTVTSHIIVTFALAAVVFVGVTIIAIARHGMKFFSYFLPPGVPLYMAPLLIPIEVLSYLARPVTLSLRLFANMMAGHTMLKVFAGFVIALGIAGVAPLTVLVGLYMLELIVAVLQAFVFTILTCLYLHDAIHLH